MSKLALFGGEKTIKKPFKAYSSIGQREKQLVAQVMDKGCISAFYGSWNDQFLGGEYVKRFEEEIKKCWQCKYAVTVNSNTSGLDISLAAIGVSPGDEIIVSPWTMSATAIAPLRWGAIPKFVDIEKETFALDPQKVIEAITTKTKAIFVTNIFGQVPYLHQLKQIAETHNLYLLEDNAQAPMAHEFGKYCGTIGDIGILSFNYHKHIHTGEGGCCLTNDPVLAQRLQMLRNHAEAVVEDAKIQDITNLIGGNYRMTELQAAIGIAQLENIDKHIDKRIEIAEFLSEITKDLNGIKPPILRKNCKNVYYCWGAIIDENKLGVSRDIFSQ
ncbi:MAG: DegT/DnrJ/EryC1/StrS family aminotransferase, partial [Pseudomonadota bacterium]